MTERGAGDAGDGREPSEPLPWDAPATSDQLRWTAGEFPDPNLETDWHAAEGEAEGGRSWGREAIAAVLTVALVITGAALWLTQRGVGPDRGDSTGQAGAGQETTSPRADVGSSLSPTVSTPTQIYSVPPLVRRELRTFVDAYLSAADRGQCARAWAQTGDIQRDKAYDDRETFCEHELPRLASAPEISTCDYEQVMTWQVTCQFGIGEDWRTINASYATLDAGAPIKVDYFTLGD